jgi:hypothetical protein
MLSSDKYRCIYLSSFQSFPAILEFIRGSVKPFLLLASRFPIRVRQNGRKITSFFTSQL